MKQIIPILLLACCMVSCLETESHYTPQIYLTYITNNHGDTLRVRKDDKTDLNYIDSVVLGDTLHFGVAFDAIGNNLQNTCIKWDETAIKLWGSLGSKVTIALTEPSDTTKLDLYFVEGFSGIGYPIHLVPLKTGSSAIRFHVATDSKYSPVDESLTINTIELAADSTKAE